MKSIVLLTLVVMVAMATANPTNPTSSRGYTYILGQRDRECEEGTHAYATNCGKKTPEATCAQPNPVEEEGILCDYSTCYCDPPTVRDEKTKKCVPLDQCT